MSDGAIPTLPVRQKRNVWEVLVPDKIGEINCSTQPRWVECETERDARAIAVSLRFVFGQRDHEMKPEELQLLKEAASAMSR